MDSVPPVGHVAIIGAGLSGLSLALALNDVDLSCSIYEARSEAYSIGSGITLSPNALRILDRLGVYPRVKKRGYHFETLEFKNGSGVTTDRYYFGSQALYGYVAFRIARQHMIDKMKCMLAERNIHIHYNSRFSHIVSETSDKVVFQFEDGQKAEAGVLIGADGIHSHVRSYIEPAVSPIYSGITAINGVVARVKVRVPNGYHLPATAMAAPGAFLMVPQEPDGSELLVGSQRRFLARDKEGWKRLRDDKQGLLSMLKEHKSDWPDVVQSVLEEMDIDRMGIWPFYGIPKLNKWVSTRGRVIILGDAAHAIPPTAGQGVNQAFEDVTMLANLLPKISSTISLENILEFWHTYRQKRVDKILELTQQMNAKRLPAAEQAKLPPNAIWSDKGATSGEGGQLRWLYEPDLEDEIERWVARRR